ncbi:MAG: Rrf2 family transcriptional regulator [Deltaproteobacteria bacterium]|nr:Rrf2 family transcriptional regulator [Deltaproteobacteria bacterium]
MISQTAEYALRAMVVIAQHTTQPILTPEIAKQTKVPPGYLAKILQALGRANLVRSQRGIGGGFLLARPADEISVLDVVNSVDPVKRIHTCPLEIAAHGVALCPLHRELDDAASLIEKAFTRCTLQRLLSEDARALCGERGRAAVPVAIEGKKQQPRPASNKQ